MTTPTEAEAQEETAAAAAAIEAPFYPRPLFHHSPTFTAPLPLTAHDIHTKLTAHPLFAGQNILHHNNHPVHVVRVVGLLVALDTFDIRHALVLDDGSGATIDAMIWRQRREAVVELPEGAAVGAVVGVEGVVGVFRGVRQVEVQKLWVLRDTVEEVAAWAEVLEMRRGVLSRPWVIEERVLERERRKAEREARAVERAVATAAVAERAFVGRRRVPGQMFEVVVPPPVERGSSLVDEQEETGKERAPKVTKYVGHRRTSKPPEAPVEPPHSPVEPVPEASRKFVGRRRPSRPPSEVPTEPTPDPEPAQAALRYAGHKRTSRPPEAPPILESPAPPPAPVVLVQATPPTFVGRRRTSRPPEVPVPTEPAPDPAMKYIGRRRTSKPPETLTERPIKEEPAADMAVKFIGRRRASKPPEEPAVAEEPVVVVAASKYIGRRRPSKPPEEPPEPPVREEPAVGAVLKYIGHRRTGSKPPEPPTATVSQEPTAAVVATSYVGHKRSKPLEPTPAATKQKYVGHKRSTTVTVLEPAYRALKRMRPLPEDDEEPAGSGSRGQKRQKLPMQPFSSSSEYCSGGSGSHRRPSIKAAPLAPASSSVFRGKRRTEPQPPILSASQVPQELLDSICLSSPASTPVSKASSPPPPLRRGRSSGMHEAAPPSVQPQPQATPQPQAQYRGRRSRPSARRSEQSTSLTPVGRAKRETYRRVRREKENNMITSSMESTTSTSTYRGSGRYSTRAMTSSQEAEQQRRSRKRSSRASRSSQEEAAYVPSGRRRVDDEDQGERRRTRSSQEAPYAPSAKRRGEEEDVEIRRMRSSQEEVEHTGFRGKRRAGAMVNIKKPATAGKIGFVGKRRSTTGMESSGGGGGKRRKLMPGPEDEKERQKEKEWEEQDEEQRLLAAIEQSPYVPTPPQKEEPAPTPTMKPKSLFLGRQRSMLLQLEEEISDFSDYVPSPANTAPKTAPTAAPVPTAANRAPANPAPVVSKFVGRRRK